MTMTRCRPVTLDLTGVDLTTEAVRTERLLLRPYRRDDVDPVYRACQSPDLQRWLTALPSPYTREAPPTSSRASRLAAGWPGTDLGCAIDVDGELVGSCGLHALTTGRLGPEVGYWVAPWARRQGYASEAARGLAQWAIDHGAPRVHLFADVAERAVAGHGAEGRLRAGGRRARLPGVPGRQPGRRGPVRAAGGQLSGGRALARPPTGRQVRAATASAACFGACAASPLRGTSVRRISP